LPKRLIATCALLIAGLTACSSGDTESKLTERDSHTTASATAKPSAKDKAPAASKLNVLTETALSKAILSADELGAGYAKDPSYEKGDDKTFCDYKQPTKHNVEVGTNFTKGSGMAMELVSIGIRQYKTHDDAKKSFDALTRAMKTCKKETIDGDQYTYAVVSAPKVGEGAIGIKISSENMDVLQTFIFDGPSLINVGGAGVTSFNADTLNSMVTAQAKQYEMAASK
jgi:hypothetical protein